MKEFINRMENHRGLSINTPKQDKVGYELYIVELLYGDQSTYSVTDKNNIRHFTPFNHLFYFFNKFCYNIVILLMFCFAYFNHTKLTCKRTTPHIIKPLLYWRVKNT